MSLPLEPASLVPQYLLSSLKVRGKQTITCHAQYIFQKRLCKVWARRWVECVIRGKQSSASWCILKQTLPTTPFVFFFMYEIMCSACCIIRNQLNSISHIQWNYSELFCCTLSVCSCIQLQYLEVLRGISEMSSPFTVQALDRIWGQWAHSNGHINESDMFSATNQGAWIVLSRSYRYNYHVLAH